jgi:uncharacterized protein (DUF2236 family)
MISATVGSEDLEHQLEVVRALAPGEMGGVFGPDSLSWRIDREALTFLGAGRALLLQLADPWVAAAIVQHSRTLADPIGRFHRTFAVVFTIVFRRGRPRTSSVRRAFGMQINRADNCKRAIAALKAGLPDQSRSSGLP